MTEGDVVNACLRYLLYKGYWVWRHNTGGFKPKDSSRFIRFGAKGSPDIIGLSPTGTFIGVECKYGKNKPTDEQLHFGEQITSRNGVYIVAYGVEDLERSL